ncbi:hypothetical protein TNCV_1730751 [Trichonephila clavipes]|nr:hypothetical protein TNCV_1730751 [Trichonephila clavipes]
MGDFTYAGNADLHYMYGRENGNGRAALYECIAHSSQIDECRITEFFSHYIVNFVKHIHFGQGRESCTQSKPKTKHLERCG